MSQATHVMTEERACHQPLVLLAPMPRRPIGLVARRYNLHHYSSKSRGTRPSSSQTSTLGISFDASTHTITSPSTSPSSSSDLLISQYRYHTIGHTSHPYSRRNSVTPSRSVSAGSSAPVVSSSSSPASSSPFLHELSTFPANNFRSSSKEGQIFRRRKSLRDKVEEMEQLKFAPFSSNTKQNPSQEEPEPSSHQAMDQEHHQAVFTLRTTGGSPPALDVDRTPTKRSSAVDHSEVEDDPGCKSTPTAPSSQNLRAQAESSSSTSVSASTSPGLSSSWSRSPSLSSSSSSFVSLPSQTRRSRSVSFEKPDSPPLSFLNSWKDIEQHDFPSSSADEALQGLNHQQYPSSATFGVEKNDSASSLTPFPVYALDKRKLGLPLPIPTSPIPRKMTRNPFERYLGLDLDVARMKQALSMSPSGSNVEPPLAAAAAATSFPPSRKHEQPDPSRSRPSFAASHDREHDLDILMTDKSHTLLDLCFRSDLDANVSTPLPSPVAMVICQDEL